MTTLTTIYYPFPTFALLIVHDNCCVPRSNFTRLDKKLNNQQPIVNGKASALSQKIINQLDNYRYNPKFKFELPLQFSGTNYQMKIWHLMQSIPAGTTLSYGSIAKLLTSAPRAVGSACGKNPLPIFIPCHRIIAANHKLGGFNSGNILFSLGIKKWLLHHEGIEI